MRGKKKKEMSLIFRVSVSQGKHFKDFCRKNGLSLSDLARKGISYEINRLNRKVRQAKRVQVHQQVLECNGDLREWAIKYNKGVVDMQAIRTFASSEDIAVSLQKLVDGGVKRGYALPQILDFIRNRANFGGSVTLEELVPIYKHSLLFYSATAPLVTFGDNRSKGIKR